MRARKSKIEGEKGSTSITTSTRSSWKARRRRGRDGTAAQRWPELGRNFNGGSAARVCGGGGFGSMGFKGGSRGAYIGAEHGLGVRAQGTRRSGDPGRIRPRVRLGWGRKKIPTSGARLAATAGEGTQSGPDVGRKKGSWVRAGLLGIGLGSFLFLSPFYFYFPISNTTQTKAI